MDTSSAIQAIGHFEFPISRFQPIGAMKLIHITAWANDPGIGITLKAYTAYMCRVVRYSSTVAQS